MLKRVQSSWIRNSTHSEKNLNKKRKSYATHTEASEVKPFMQRHEQIPEETMLVPPFWQANCCWQAEILDPAATVP